jgi:hypothetical protein
LQDSSLPELPELLELPELPDSAVVSITTPCAA